MPKTSKASATKTKSTKKKATTVKAKKATSKKAVKKTKATSKSKAKKSVKVPDPEALETLNETGRRKKNINPPVERRKRRRQIDPTTC